MQAGLSQWDSRSSPGGHQGSVYSQAHSLHAARPTWAKDPAQSPPEKSWFRGVVGGTPHCSIYGVLADSSERPSDLTLRVHGPHRSPSVSPQERGLVFVIKSQQPHAQRSNFFVLGPHLVLRFCAQGSLICGARDQIGCVQVSGCVPALPQPPTHKLESNSMPSSFLSILSEKLVFHPSSHTQPFLTSADLLLLPSDPAQEEDKGGSHEPNIGWQVHRLMQEWKGQSFPTGQEPPEDEEQLLHSTLPSPHV